MRISDWSSDVCSSDLGEAACCNTPGGSRDDLRGGGARVACPAGGWLGASPCSRCAQKSGTGCVSKDWRPTDQGDHLSYGAGGDSRHRGATLDRDGKAGASEDIGRLRSEEHTSELQSLMRISYAVFCLKKNKSTKVQEIRQ